MGYYEQAPKGLKNLTFYSCFFPPPLSCDWAGADLPQSPPYVRTFNSRFLLESLVRSAHVLRGLSYRRFDSKPTIFLLTDMSLIVI